MNSKGLLVIAVTVLIVVLLLVALFVRLVKQNIPVMRLRFTGGDDSPFGRRFSQILNSFLRGHNLASNPFTDIDVIRDRFDAEFDDFYRGFAYEGAGMGFGARSMLRPGKRGRTFERYICQLNPDHIYQYYVGLGWWLYTMYRFRPSPYQRWIRNMDPYYAPMLYDGVGFKAGLFDYGINPSLIHHLKCMGESPLRVGCQGYGRSLWFQCRYEILPVLSILANAPQEVRQDLMSGVGLAVAYSLFDNPERVQGICRVIPESYLASFKQGMAFGWEARKLQNGKYWDELTNTFDQAWSSKMEDGVKAVHLARELVGSSNPETHYIRWMDKTRQFMKNYDVIGGWTCLRS
ncbi:hypothetical protein ABD76_18410 [Paenibacillus dendritiformis]|uniref:DUF1702 family protein n=1 Tax=Paenibacillus dendritiformis TaxID=130049 RepID=UPI0018CCBCFC|nr:DUF1702 family protein [Paenibacillus dendritiformis]MBG9794373.1 hypothetical protein [Paenibacillus dendritiformis]